MLTALEIERTFDRAYAVRAARARLHGDAATAEDIAQEAYVRAVTEARAGRLLVLDAQALRTWSYRVVMNLCTSHQRAAGRRSRHEQAAALPDETTPISEEKERAPGDVAAALASLPAIYREAVELRVMLGYDYDEIAELLHETEGNLRKRVCVGLRMLRESLGVADSGNGEADSVV